MPVWESVGYPPVPGDGRTEKHVREDCEVLVDRERLGFPKRKILRNMDKGSHRPVHTHRRRRCPVCMPDSDYPDVPL